MSDGSSPVTVPEGLAPATPDATGTTAQAPEAPNTGQAQATSPDSGQAQAPVSDEPTFFDPSALPPELLPGYKQMQSAFTKKMQAISQDRQKIDLYNRFETDPTFQAQVLQNLAAQHGYQLSRKDAQQMVNQAQQQQQAQDWQPQTWDEVIARTKQEAREEIMRELQPFLGNVQKVTANNIERQLSEIDPQWRTYEDEMRSKLQRHPTLVNDVAELYRLSVPEDVLTSKAVQQAMQKFQAKAEQGRVSGTSRTSRSEPAAPDITKLKDGDAFNMAVELARKKLASGG